MKKLTLIIWLLILSGTILSQEFYINDIQIQRKDVFEKDDKDWFFAAPLLNALHFKTREYIIRDELLFDEGDPLDPEYLRETERNLRRTDLFTKVDVTIDSVGPGLFDVYVTTKDRWSTYPAVLFGTGGGESNYGGGIQEYNLFGTGTYVKFEGLHRTENNTGWQGQAALSQRRLFRSELSLDATLLSNKYRTEQAANIMKPYRTLETKYAYGVHGTNKFGDDFLYKGNERQKLPFHERKANLWFSKGWWRKDRVFMTVKASWEDVQRLDSAYRQAFDNSGSILLNFSSVSRDYYTVKNVDNYFIADLPVGGYGSATLGKVFPIGSNGESLYYASGHGERSYYKNNLYLYGKIAGGSGFFGSTAKYTYQEFTGIGFYKLNKKHVLTTRIRQQTVWNWPRLRQLILDSDYGLRGYKANRFSNDNRIIGNLEYRFYPGFNLWIFDVSGAAFYDIGTTWDQYTKLKDTKFYSSLGAGLRFHFTKSRSPDHLFRVDLAYNLHDGKLGGIIFTTKQLFNAFGSHEFSLPKLLGRAFDYE